MQRIFLSWDKPACQLVAERLLNYEKDIYRHVVLVPTKESGRQLREQLAVHAAHQAIFPPTVMPADQFLQMGDTEERAGNIEELAAWVMALGDDAFRTYGTLFPKQLPSDFSCLLDIAANMQQLRRNMASQGLTCEKAAACASEDNRWPDIASLTERYKSQLAGLGLKDRAELSLKARPSDALQAQLKESGGSIIVACVPDLTAPLCKALHHAEALGIPVQIWINAPEAEADSFDDMGHPLQSVWEERSIPLTDDQITVTANPERLAEQTCRLIAEKSRDVGPDIALMVCDPDMNVAIDAKLREFGWGLHNPEGQTFAGTGLMKLLKVLGDIPDNEGRAANLIKLCHSTLLCSSLDIDNQQQCCAALDKINNTYLPEREQYLISCLKTHYPETEKALRPISAWRNNMLTPGRLGKSLQDWLPNLEKAYGDDTEALSTFRKGVEGLARLQSITDHFNAPEKALRLLMRSLQNSRVKSRRPDYAQLDSLGWMEALFRSERDLILTGMNEGIVPEGRVVDQFMPESFKADSGINSLARLKARDSFLLTALLNSRRTFGGSISIVLSRISSNNDPLTSSSLLMRCANDDLPKRINMLFGEIHDIPEPLPYRRGDWFLQPIGGWQKGQTIEEIAPGFENPWKHGKIFSPSTLRKFLECPMRFWVEQVLNLKDNELLPEKLELKSTELGNVMHEVLRVFCQKYSTYSDNLNLEVMKADIASILDENFLQNYGPNPLAPLLIQKSSMLERLLIFTEHHLEDLSAGWSCIAFELEVDWKMEDFPMNFIIDRIDRNTHGDVRVIDYKTGSAHQVREAHLSAKLNPDKLDLLSPKLFTFDTSLKNGKIKQERWINLQLPIYVLWAQSVYGGQPTAAYYNLPPQSQNIDYSEWTGLHDLPQNAVFTELENAKAWIIELMRLITEGRGFISAEQLGWEKPKYSIIDQLLDKSGKEEITKLLNIQ